jgi:replicative DNA helicase
MFNSLAEQSVIGSMMLNAECIDDVNLSDSDFYSETHRLIYKTIIRLHAKGKAIDVITIAERLESDSELEKVGGLQYLGHIARNTPSSANVKSYADIVRDLSILRSLQSISADIHSQAESKVRPLEIAETAERKIFELMQEKDDREPVMLKDALEEALIAVEQRYSGAAIAMPTGLSDLDELLGGGFHKGSLNILAARPKAGKTACACTMALSSARSGGAIYFASLEMPRREIANRMIAITSGWPTDAIMKDHNSSDAISFAITTLSEMKIMIDDEVGLTVGKLRSRARKMQRKIGLTMIVVDYLQLMRGEGQNREQEIASISRGLKGMSKELDIPILCLAQVNRDCESRADKRPMMSDLRESGAIEQDADLIMMIYRDEVYNKESELKGIAEILVRANRHGPCGEILTMFNGALTKFSNLSKEWRRPETPQQRGRGL